MASLFGALGSLAESYGLARRDVFEQRRLEAEARRQEMEGTLEQERIQMEQKQIEQEGVRTELERARLKQEIAQASRPMFLGNPYIRNGKQYQRYWDPTGVNAQGGQGKISEMEVGEEAEGALASFVRQYTKLYGHAPSEDLTMEAVFKVKPTSTTEGNYEIAARDWHYYGIKPPKDMLVGAEKAMAVHGWAPGRTLTGMEGRTLEQTKEAENQARVLRKYLEDNNLTTANNWLSGSQSLLQRYKATGEYLMGHDPTDDVSSQLGLLTSATGILGALPYMQSRGGKYMYDQISLHLPKMRDTPALMYKKTGQLLRIFDEIKRDVSTTGAEGFFPDVGQFGDVPIPGGASAPAAAAPPTSQRQVTIDPVTGAITVK